MSLQNRQKEIIEYIWLKMLKFSKHGLIFFFCMLLSVRHEAQKLTQFSSDTVKFMDDLKTYYIEYSANKQLAEDYVKKLEKLWKDNVIAGYYKEIAIETSNTMLGKRMKPYPYFQGYFNTLVNSIQSGHSYENFENWQACVNKLLAGKSNRGVQEFFDMSENVFKDNTFYKTPSYRYYTREPNFVFNYDTIPRLIFKEITLIGANPRGDSIAIEETEGVFYPTNGRFSGNGGTVSWEKTGLDNSVNAKLRRFSIDCKTGTYSADSAVFTGKQFFDKPQLGKVTDRIVTEGDDKTYPRFDSYSKRLLVKNIYPDVDYDGGFGMRGAKFVGSGSGTNPARIIFRLDDKKFLEVTARAFGMSQEKIVASPGTIKFFLDKDTIYHPGVSFTYQVEKRQVTILRGDDGLQKTPFLNSFHMVDMYFEQIIWQIDEPTLAFNFLPNNFQGEAFFESSDFYSTQKAESIKMGEKISPITRMIEFYNANNKQPTFSVRDMAVYIKYLANDLRPIIFKMAISGLIYFNPETDMITVRQRLFDYADNAKHKHDYDIITLHSVNPGKDNANMNLLNFDLTVHGVKMVLLSDTQKVWMFPRNAEITLKKNRNMEFSGTLASGKFEFIGKDFFFDYEQFKVKMKTIDSIKIFVEAFEPDVNGNVPFKKVQTLIENVNGELSIDAPKNKSGWGKAPTFPSFKSFKESFAFYDRRQIYKGVYGRDKFYFRLDPFGIDSLDNFRNEGLRFKGVFSSAGIFPDFEETLTLQKDYSLGFIRQSPPDGYPIYKGKGNFNQEIRLSNKGLRGGGDLNFSSSLSKVPDLVFFPDSANGMANTFDVKEGDSPEFPVVHGDSVRLHFMPYQDLLQAYDIKKPFRAYKENVSFRGRYDLSFKELTGNGKVDFEKASLTAGKILFVKRRFFSDTANFNLKAFNEEGFTFSTVNVNAKIDFDQRVGEFITNGEGSYVRFDKNQYIAYMDRFKWFMDAEEIELGDESKKMNTEDAENGLDLEGPEFISVHPNQDSLRFLSPAAKYNLRKYIIRCKNVPYIDVADARMFPNNGDVTIYKNAVMDTLRQSSIMANTVTKYHRIRNTTVNVFGRKNYLAKGEYQYVDENEKPFLIYFKTIKPDATGQTISEGDIAEKDNFRFNDYFSFAGRVYLEASKEFLTFDGGTKIVHNCSHVGKSYLKFSGEINPKEILIPIPKKALDMRGMPVGTGLFFTLDSNAVYPTFISLQGSRAAKDLIEADGLLTYDRENKKYEISNKEKLEEMSLPGNYVSLSTEDCKMYAEGSYNLSVDLGQVKIRAVGNSEFDTQHDSGAYNFMLAIDFFFDNGALKKMSKDMELYLGSLNPVPFEGDLFNHGIIELLGKERGDRALSELNLYGNYKKFPDELEKSLVFNDVKMLYNRDARAYLSQGQLGLGNILKSEIFRYLNGVIMLKKQRGGDALDIYLEADPNTWYYFTYFKGTMLAISSNEAFNTALQELKGKNKKMDVDKGPSYRFDLTNKKKKDLFLNKVKQLGAMGGEEKKEDE
ncbi:MAG TPA: hypothetical protein PLQ93_07470 [Bacteroidia bacterium]|nr:hypothetical protein [Bacteroidia bacterium]